MDLAEIKSKSRNYFLTLCEEDLLLALLHMVFIDYSSRNYFLTLCEEDRYKRRDLDGPSSLEITSSHCVRRITIQYISDVVIY